MKALKKVLLGITAMAMTVAMFSFVACTDDNPDDSTSTSVTSSTTTSSETTSSETASSETASDAGTSSGDEQTETTLTGTFSGEYKYPNTYAEGSYYGVKVAVVVEDDVIKSVETIDTDYIEVSDSMTQYGWDQTVYTEAKADYLAKFEGKTVTEILAIEVACEDSGEPTIQSSENFVSYDSDLLLTGATQCSGRTILAVQNALTEQNVIYIGEYTYPNTYAEGSYYGVKVAVEVENGAIKSVETIDTDYIEVSDSMTQYGWDQTVYTEAKASLLAAYEGKTVSDILAITVACEDSGEPTIQSSENFVSYDSDLLLTGATQCSGRLILAIQNALASLA